MATVARMKVKTLKQYLSAGSFGISLLLHGLIFFVVGGMIIVDAVKPKATFMQVEGGDTAQVEEMPPLPDMPDENVPVSQDTPVTQDSTPAPSVSIDQISSSVATTVPTFMMAPPTGLDKGAGGLPSGLSGGGRGEGSGLPRVFSPFGRSEAAPDALRGTIYDLKTKRQGGSTGDNPVAKLQETMSALYKNKGDKSYLDSRFYQAPTNLYTTSIFVMPMDANNATSSFKCDDKIKSPGWMAYYEGWMTPPETGEYRFTGMADDNMMVIVNRKVVLHAFWPQQQLGTMIPTGSDWEPNDASKTDGWSVMPTVPANLKHLARYRGGWMRLEKGTAYEIKIILTEAYGGIYSATLGIEQKGVAYPPGTGPGPQTELPIFKQAEFSEAEITAFKQWRSSYVTTGPNFGLSANGVRKPE